MADLDGIRARAQAASIHLDESRPCCSGHRSGEDVPTLLRLLEESRLFAEGLMAGADQLRAQAAKQTNAITELHEALADHMEHLGDKQPWDNRAMFNRLLEGLHALIAQPTDTTEPIVRETNHV